MVLICSRRAITFLYGLVLMNVGVIMTLNVNATSPASTNTDTAHGIKTANLVKDQMELEGQMALQLIQSANVDTQVSAPVGNIGNNINIQA